MSVTEILLAIGDDRIDKRATNSMARALRNMGIKNKKRSGGSTGFAMPPKKPVKTGDRLFNSRGG